MDAVTSIPTPITPVKGNYIYKDKQAKTLCCMATYGRMVYLFQMYRIIQSRRSQDEGAASGSWTKGETAGPHVDS